MRPRALALAAPVLLVLSACAATAGRVPVATSPPPTGTAPDEFNPTGEVQVVGLGVPSSSASFDAWRVSGPRVNVARVDASTWGGHVGDRDLRVQVRPGRISGAGVSIAVERSGETLVIGGVLGEARLRFEITARHLRGTVGRRTYEMAATAPGHYVGNNRILHLTGAAADLTNPAMPQLALALIAATTTE
jgi:hypothetical protein